MADENQFEDAPPADVIGTAYKLAQILHKDPSSLDEETFARGDELLAIFSNMEFGETKETRAFKGQAKTQKLEIIQQAIDDLAARGKILSHSYLGVTFTGKRSSSFICKYIEAPQGEVIYSIELRDPDTFNKWRKGSKEDLTENELNAGLYRLAYEWAQLL